MRFSRRTIVIASGAIAAVVIAVMAVLLTSHTSALLTSHTSAARPGRPAVTPSIRPAAQLLSPFTGEPIPALGPVLVVKIDNVAQARPPTGLTKADIVYMIPVEGGLSRIFAVFSSHFPPVIGPVRSTREDDIELLRQFGTPAFAFSGAQPHLLPVVEHSRIVDLYSGRVGGYYRDLNRLAPHNLYARTKQLLAEASRASKARDIGFRFGPAPAGGQPRSVFSVSYPAASFGFRWSAQRSAWLVSMDGTPAGSTEDGQLRAATVVIQYTRVGTSRFLEANVGRPPYAYTVGSGRAVVLRDGRSHSAHWSRPQADGGTTFTTASGQPMTFARGQVWVILAYGPGSG